jgi:hypothetical protein
VEDEQDRPADGTPALDLPLVVEPRKAPPLSEPRLLFKVDDAVEERVVDSPKVLTDTAWRACDESTEAVLRAALRAAPVTVVVWALDDERERAESIASWHATSRPSSRGMKTPFGGTIGRAAMPHGSPLTDETDDR